MSAIAYVAGDAGARLTLQSVADCLPGTWLALDANDNAQEWRRGLHSRNIALLMCGTSDSSAGRALEQSARISANALAIPSIVIEDFPGNYYAAPGGKPRLVVVGAEVDARRVREKDGPLDVTVCPCVRYDPLRRRLAELRSNRSAAENAILWVGQPETADSLATLNGLLPALRDVEIWFRAHPRDTGYGSGAYTRLPIEDLTRWPLHECLTRRPRLVVTQFSSVAIEAGFWGIPSLHALIPDLGGRALSEKKGYAIPPWCEAGAAFLVVQRAEIELVVQRALYADAAREAVMQSFDRYFQVHTQGAPVLIDVLYNQGLL